MKEYNLKKIDIDNFNKIDWSLGLEGVLVELSFSLTKNGCFDALLHLKDGELNTYLLLFLGIPLTFSCPTINSTFSSAQIGLSEQKYNGKNLMQFDFGSSQGFKICSENIKVFNIKNTEIRPEVKFVNWDLL